MGRRENHDAIDPILVVGGRIISSLAAEVIAPEAGRTFPSIRVSAPASGVQGRHSFAGSAKMDRFADRC
jgi:hypothetical protein